MPQKLQFIKNSQPKFIQQFKERVGLAQTTTVNDKVPTKSAELDDQSDKEDEKPVVVLLKDNSITEEELKRVEEGEGKKMKFRKPSNKRSAIEQGISASSKKASDFNTKKRRKTNSKKVLSTNLLSFNDNDDEEEDV